MQQNVRISRDFVPNAGVVYYKGDVRNLIPKIPNGSVQLVVCSPPYNIGKEYEKKVPLDTYLSQQDEIISAIIPKVHEKGSICWEVGNFVENSHIVPLDLELYPLFKKHNLKLRNRIVWTFGHGLHAQKRFSGRYEVILWFTKSDDYVFNLDPVRIRQLYPEKKHHRGPKKGQLSGNPKGKNPSDVWRFDVKPSTYLPELDDFWEIPNVKFNHVEKTEHPAQYPVELVQRLIRALTNPGDLIFDPFMGVGSTAVAAVMEKRRVVGAEINRDYVKIGEERIRKAWKGELPIREIGTPIYKPPESKDNLLNPSKVSSLLREDDNEV